LSLPTLSLPPPLGLGGGRLLNLPPITSGEGRLLTEQLQAGLLSPITEASVESGDGFLGRVTSATSSTTVASSYVSALSRVDSLDVREGESLLSRVETGATLTRVETGATAVLSPSIEMALERECTGILASFEEDQR
jgi:hypothetical protein